mmetsp:Transcript_10359/g.32885  ORF Transcript_10359/g.32885 Transcript_10359/m.32885 type:complete len:302 (+) Transcript_10359:1051-1956(+)
MNKTIPVHTNFMTADEAALGCAVLIDHHDQDAIGACQPLDKVAMRARCMAAPGCREVTITHEEDAEHWALIVHPALLHILCAAPAITPLSRAILSSITGASTRTSSTSTRVSRGSSGSTSSGGTSSAGSGSTLPVVMRVLAVPLARTAPLAVQLAPVAAAQMRVGLVAQTALALSLVRRKQAAETRVGRCDAAGVVSLALAGPPRIWLCRRCNSSSWQSGSGHLVRRHAGIFHHISISVLAPSPRTRVLLPCKEAKPAAHPLAASCPARCPRWHWRPVAVVHLVRHLVKVLPHVLLDAHCT